MNTVRLGHLIRIAGLVGALWTSTALAVETTNLRVAYVEGPAADALQAGKVRDAINLLEETMASPEYEPKPNMLSSLCAAYVLGREFEIARSVCDLAVETDASELAFNNRGVLRAQIGDFEGALKDLERIRVPRSELNNYLVELTSANARLMATNNFDLVRKVRSALQGPVIETAGKISGADVESVVN